MPEDAQSNSASTNAKSEVAVSWARERLDDAGPFLAPVMAALVVIGLFCVYYFIYVRAQREYLVNRNFRALAALGDQIEGNIGNHINVLRYFVDQVDSPDRYVHDRQKVPPPGVDDKETREDYMRFLAPDLHLDEGELTGKNLDVRRHNGRWELTMAADGKTKGFSGTVSFQQLVQPFVGSLPFDDVLLASESGAIIYQKAKTGPQFITLAGVLESQAEAPAGEEKSAGDAKDSPIQANAAADWQKKPIHLTEIAVAGVRYKLFLQPVLIDVFGENGKGGNGSDKRAREWVLCGLVPTARLEWQSLAISYRVVIWATVVFLIVCLSAPLLKFLFLNKREPLRLRECALAGLCLILLTSVMTFAGLQAVYFHLGDPDQGEKQLEQISSGLAVGVHQELAAMLSQLTSFCHEDRATNDLVESEDREVYELNREGSFQRDSDSYPYFRNVFWTDDDGHQLVKWSGSRWATPMIDMAPVDLFKNLEEPNLPDHPLFYLDSPSAPFHLESTLAPNKIEYLAALGMRTQDCNADFAWQTPSVRPDILAGRVFLVAKPFSLIDPVLPPGYGFALVDLSGKVLFHSDKTKNTRENFLEESDWNQELYAAVFGHSGGQNIQIKYLGEDYLVHVAKIPHLAQAPWSLIVYRDLTYVRTLNLQTMAISSTLFLLILFCPTAIAALLYVIQRPRYISKDVWPHEDRLATYAYQTGVAIIFSVLLLVLSLNAPADERVVCSAILLYAALLFIYWGFRLYPSEAIGGRMGIQPRMVIPAMLTGLFAILAMWIVFAQHFWRMAGLMPVAGICAIFLLEGPRRQFHRMLPRFLTFRVSYTLSLISLLLLMGILIPVTLFRASLRVERRLQAKQAEVHLAAAFERREGLDRGLCEPEDLKCRLVLGTFPSAGWNFTGAAKPHAGADHEPYQAWFRELVYSLHHDYNRVAAETLAMVTEGPLPDLAPPGYWKSEVVSGGVVLLITTLVVWIVGNKLFLHDIVPLRAWKEQRGLRYLKSPYAGRVGELIWTECFPTPDLQSIGKGLATELAEEHPSDEMVIMQFLERATEYYGRLWRDCSEDEQFALTQLASDGLLNPANTAAIGQLLKRGLIIREPQFRIMNESFRRFVVAAPAAELRQRWLDESRASGWGKARGVFSTVAILVAIFLLTTQNALWQSAAGYVTTAIGGFGTFLKLFHTVRGEKAS